MFQSIDLIHVSPPVDTYTLLYNQLDSNENLDALLLTKQIGNSYREPLVERKCAIIRANPLTKLVAVFLSK